MFTNQYIVFRKVMFTGNAEYMNNVSGSKFQGAASKMYECDLGKWMGIARCGDFTAEADSLSDVYPGVYFGSGSTPATKADIRLVSPITSGLTFTNPTSLVWTNDGNGKYSVAADFIVRNTSESEINIYEIGLFTACVRSTGKTYRCLMERTVLDVPIVIAPGEAKLVTYKITFNQTLNVE